ncbi:DNA-binding response regulator [Microvirga flavescens]|uniref:DNA-binding response regulator n=1 Tax=Microvirga flavescens TaxID=2249811 RepID=UPI000DD997FB|nr:DNA-binding response regulator [Microvirga flavescens]
MTTSEVNSQTVLYIDHDENSRSAFASGLRNIGYVVIEAESAKDAIAMLGDNSPDFIICDDALPNFAAVELLKAVREGHNSLDATPFIFVSACADRKEMLRLRELGADDILSKPIDLELVEVTLQACSAQVRRLQRSKPHVLKRRDAGRSAGHAVGVEVSISNLAETLDGMSRGVIYLDSSGAVRNMNRTADAILSKGSALQIVSGRLSIIQAPSARNLREAVRAATAQKPCSSIVPIPREAQTPLVLHVCPLDTGGRDGLPTVAIMIIDPSAPPPLSASIIAQIYGFTRSEARIAVALAHGNRLDEIAELFGVSQATVAFHVQNLFRKTQTARQSDLVALLLRSSISTPVLQIAA